MRIEGAGRGIDLIVGVLSALVIFGCVLANVALFMWTRRMSPLFLAPLAVVAFSAEAIWMRRAEWVLVVWCGVHVTLLLLLLVFFGRMLLA